MKRLILFCLLITSISLSAQVTDSFEELSDAYETEFWHHWKNENYRAAQAFLLQMHTAYYSLPKEQQNLHQSEMVTICYNLACAYAIQGKTDQGLDALREAVQFGWKDQAYTMEDSDLESLRQEPAFKDIIRRMNRRTPYVKVI